MTPRLLAHGTFLGEHPHLTPALSSPGRRRGRNGRCSLRSLSVLPGRQARTAQVRRARMRGAKRTE